ncbi:conserved hypothetical protein [Neospora caninum Liverpool]|uniref:Uncharacterized protein n=1 Tax=Neospora caninum (strain Liverpool) TaxID=572307 RepID=F0VKZ7_NEOCL|nr:conserved hypothetical protein [Neospora caninum Liverpool]CBZ54749.1 conserved hypothetical protein [Neospora caninum Liverpool]|eukprot:XP_003884777.1 conserved hypothetical protein [Neospora caninum Liverpool]
MASFVDSPGLIGGVTAPALGTFPSPVLSPSLSSSCRCISSSSSSSGLDLRLDSERRRAPIDAACTGDGMQTKTGGTDRRTRFSAGVAALHVGQTEDCTTGASPLISGDAGRLSSPSANQREKTPRPTRQSAPRWEHREKGDAETGEDTAAGDENKETIEGVWIARGIDVPDLSAHLTCVFRASTLEVFNTSPSVQILAVSAPASASPLTDRVPLADSPCCRTSGNSNGPSHAPIQLEMPSRQRSLAPTFPLLLRVPVPAPLASRKLFDAGVFSTPFSTSQGQRGCTRCAPQSPNRRLAGREKKSFFRSLAAFASSQPSAWRGLFPLRFPSLCHRRKQPSRPAFAVSIKRPIDKRVSQERREPARRRAAGRWPPGGVNEARQEWSLGAHRARDSSQETVVVFAFVTADRQLHHVRLRLRRAGETGEDRRLSGDQSNGDEAPGDTRKAGVSVVCELLDVASASLDVELSLGSSWGVGGASSPLPARVDASRRAGSGPGDAHSTLTANSHLFVVDDRSLLLSFPGLGCWGLLVMGACEGSAGEAGQAADLHEGLGDGPESRKRPRQSHDDFEGTEATEQRSPCGARSGKRRLDAALVRASDPEGEMGEIRHADGVSQAAGATAAAASGAPEDGRGAETFACASRRPHRQAVWLPAPFSLPPPRVASAHSRPHGEAGVFSLFAPFRALPFCSPADASKRGGREDNLCRGSSVSESGRGLEKNVADTRRIWARATFVARLAPSSAGFEGWLGGGRLAQHQGGKREVGKWCLFRRRSRDETKAPSPLLPLPSCGFEPSLEASACATIFVVTCGPVGHQTGRAGDEGESLDGAKTCEECRGGDAPDEDSRAPDLAGDGRKGAHMHHLGSEVEHGRAQRLSPSARAFDGQSEEKEDAPFSLSATLAEICVWQIGVSCTLDSVPTHSRSDSSPFSSAGVSPGRSSFSLLARRVLRLSPPGDYATCFGHGQPDGDTAQPTGFSPGSAATSRRSVFPVETLLIAENARLGAREGEETEGLGNSERRSWIAVVDSRGRSHLLEWRVWGICRAAETTEMQADADDREATLEEASESCLVGTAGCALTYVECISFSHSDGAKAAGASQGRQSENRWPVARRTTCDVGRTLAASQAREETEGQWLLTDTHLWRLPWGSSEEESSRQGHVVGMGRSGREGTYVHAFPLPSSAPWRKNAFPSLSAFRIPLAHSPAPEPPSGGIWSPQTCRARLEHLLASLRSLRSRSLVSLGAAPDTSAPGTVSSRWRAAAVLLAWVARALEPSDSSLGGSSCSASSLCQFLLCAEQRDPGQARCDRAHPHDVEQIPESVSLKRLLWGVTLLTVQRADSCACGRASGNSSPSHSPSSRSPPHSWSRSRSVSPQRREDKRAFLADPLLAAVTASIVLCRFLVDTLDAGSSALAPLCASVAGENREGSCKWKRSNAQQLRFLVSGRAEAGGFFLGASRVWWEELEREKRILDCRDKGDEGLLDTDRKAGIEAGGGRCQAAKVCSAPEGTQTACALPMIFSYSSLPAFVVQNSSTCREASPSTSSFLSPLGPLAASLSLLRPATSLPESILLQLASLARAVGEDAHALGLESAELTDENGYRGFSPDIEAACGVERGYESEAETPQPEGDSGEPEGGSRIPDEATLAECFFLLHAQPEPSGKPGPVQKRVARRSSSPSSRGGVSVRPTRRRKAGLQAARESRDASESENDGEENGAVRSTSRLRLPVTEARERAATERLNPPECSVASAAVHARQILFPVDDARKATDQIRHETVGDELHVTGRDHEEANEENPVVLEAWHLSALQRFFLRCMQRETGGISPLTRDTHATWPRSILIREVPETAFSVFRGLAREDRARTGGGSREGGTDRQRGHPGAQSEGEIERTIETLLRLSSAPSWRILLAGCLRLEASLALARVVESWSNSQKGKTEGSREEREVDADDSATEDEWLIHDLWVPRLDDVESLLRRVLGRGESGTSQRETPSSNTRKGAEDGQKSTKDRNRQNRGQTRCALFSTCSSVTSALRLLKSDTSLLDVPSTAEGESPLDAFLVFRSRVNRLVDALLSPLLRQSPSRGHLAPPLLPQSPAPGLDLASVAPPLPSLFPLSWSGQERAAVSSQQGCSDRVLPSLYRSGAAHILSFSLFPSSVRKELGSASPSGPSPASSLDACLSLLPFASVGGHCWGRSALPVRRGLPSGEAVALPPRGPREAPGHARQHACAATTSEGLLDNPPFASRLEELLSPRGDSGRAAPSQARSGRSHAAEYQDAIFSAFSRLGARVVGPALGSAVVGSYFLLAALAASTDWAIAAVLAASGTPVDIGTAGALEQNERFRLAVRLSLDPCRSPASSWDPHLATGDGRDCSPESQAQGRQQRHICSPHPALERKNAFSLEADPQAWRSALRGDASRSSSPTSCVSLGVSGGLESRRAVHGPATSEDADGDTRGRTGDSERAQRRRPRSDASPGGFFSPRSYGSSSPAGRAETSPGAGAAANQSLHALQTSIDGSCAFPPAFSPAFPLLLLHVWRAGHAAALRATMRRRERTESARDRAKKWGNDEREEGAEDSELSFGSRCAADPTETKTSSPRADAADTSSFLAFFLRALCQHTLPSTLLARAEASETLASVLAQSPLAEHRVAAHALQIWVLLTSVSLFAHPSASPSPSFALSPPVFFLLLGRAASEVHSHALGAVLETGQSFSLLQKTASTLCAAPSAAASASLLRPFLRVLSPCSPSKTRHLGHATASAARSETEQDSVDEEERFLARCCVSVLRNGENQRPPAADDRFLVKSLEALLLLRLSRHFDAFFPFSATPSLAASPTASPPPLLLPSRFHNPTATSWSVSETPGSPRGRDAFHVPGSCSSLFPCSSAFVAQCRASSAVATRSSPSLKALVLQSAARAAAEARESLLLPRNPDSLISPICSRDASPTRSPGPVQNVAAAFEGEVWNQLFLAYVACGQLFGALEILPRLSSERKETGVLAILAFVIRARLRRGDPQRDETEDEADGAAPVEDETKQRRERSRRGSWEAGGAVSPGKEDGNRTEPGNPARDRQRSLAPASAFVEKKAEVEALADFSLETLRRACTKRLNLFIDQILFRAALATHAATGPAREAYELLKQDLLASSRFEDAVRLAFLHAASIRASCASPVSAPAVRTPCPSSFLSFFSSFPGSSPHSPLSPLCGAGEAPTFNAVFGYLYGGAASSPGLARLSDAHLHSVTGHRGRGAFASGAAAVPAALSSACAKEDAVAVAELDFPSWTLLGLGELQRLMETGTEGEDGDAPGREAGDTCAGTERASLAGSCFLFSRQGAEIQRPHKLQSRAASGNRATVARSHSTFSERVFDPAVSLEAVLEDLTLCSNLLCCLSSSFLFLPPVLPSLFLPLTPSLSGSTADSVGDVCVLVAPNPHEAGEGEDMTDDESTPVNLDQFASPLPDLWASSPSSRASALSEASFLSAAPSPAAAMHARATPEGEETEENRRRSSSANQPPAFTQLVPATATLLVDDEGSAAAGRRTQAQAHAFSTTFLNKLVELTRGRLLLLSQTTDAAEVFSHQPWSLEGAEVVVQLGFAGRLADAVQLASHLELDLLLPFLSFVCFILRTYVIVVDPLAPASFSFSSSLSPPFSALSPPPSTRRAAALFPPGGESAAGGRSRFHSTSLSVSSLLAAHAAEERRRGERRHMGGKKPADRVSNRQRVRADLENEEAGQAFASDADADPFLTSVHGAEEETTEEEARRGAYSCWLELVKQLHLRFLRVDKQLRSHPWLQPLSQLGRETAEADAAQGVFGEPVAAFPFPCADGPSENATLDPFTQTALRFTGGRSPAKVEEEGATRRLHASLLSELHTVTRQFPHAIPSFVFEYLRAASLPSHPVEALGQLLRDDRLGDAFNLVKHHSRFRLRSRSSVSAATDGTLADWIASLPPTGRPGAFRMTFLALSFPLVLQLHARLEDIRMRPSSGGGAGNNAGREDESETAARLLRELGQILADYQKAARMVDRDAASLTALALRPPVVSASLSSSAACTSSRVL